MVAGWEKKQTEKTAQLTRDKAGAWPLSLGQASYVSLHLASSLAKCLPQRVQNSFRRVVCRVKEHQVRLHLESICTRVSLSGMME